MGMKKSEQIQEIYEKYNQQNFMGWDSGRDRTPIKNSEVSGLSCWVNDDAIIQRENTAGRASLARKTMSSVLQKS